VGEDIGPLLPGVVALNHFTVLSPLLFLQANGRLLCCHSLFRDPVREIPPRPLAFDPALFEQPLPRYGIFGKFDSADPTATAQLLHELPFAVIGYKRHGSARCSG
jgi:hypothetical protein